MRLKITGIMKHQGYDKKCKPFKRPFDKQEKRQIIQDLIKVLNKHESFGKIEEY